MVVNVGKEVCSVTDEESLRTDGRSEINVFLVLFLGNVSVGSGENVVLKLLDGAIYFCIGLAVELWWCVRVC